MQATVKATIRSIVPAGGALLLAMLIAPLVFPGPLVRSVAVAVTAVTVLSMMSAICVVPALLKLLGSKLERWSLPKRRDSQVAPLRWSRESLQAPWCGRW